MQNNKAVDKFGNLVSSSSPEARIPLEEFIFRDDLSMEIDREQILLGLLEIIENVSDKEYQRRVWIRAEGPECDDFCETCCNFFPTCESILDKYKDFEILDNQYQILKQFHKEFDDFSDSEEREYLEKDFINTPEWTKVTEMAKEVLKVFGYQIKQKYFIELNRSEYTCFCRLNKQHAKLLFTYKENTDIYLIQFSEDQADEIRDLCGEQLQIAGFDEKYELTPEGEILESLIDKFFIE